MSLSDVDAHTSNSESSSSNKVLTSSVVPRSLISPSLTGGGGEDACSSQSLSSIEMIWNNVIGELCYCFGKANIGKGNKGLIF